MIVGYWWNDKSIEVAEIDGMNVALNGWNGEVYTDCFFVSGEIDGIFYNNDGDAENVVCIYSYDEENDYTEITGYKYF